MDYESDLQKVLIQWRGAQGFTIADAQSGVVVFGATGSGKTIGPAQLIARSYLRAGMGGLVLCSKVEERKSWEIYAQKEGRSHDLVFVDATGSGRFNFLEWAANQGGEGAGYTINLVSLLEEIGSLIDEGAGEGDGGDNAFFRNALRHLLVNLVDLPLLGGCGSSCD